MNKTIGSNFKELKFQRKNKVISLQSANFNKVIKKKKIIIGPTLILQRIAVTSTCTFPSLFDNGLMRKTTKSKLYDFFTPLEEYAFNEHCSFVIESKNKPFKKL